MVILWLLILLGMSWIELVLLLVIALISHRIAQDYVL